MASEGIVIADFHHPGLFQSLMFLFEKRLGFELYRPYGMDWATEGFVLNPKTAYYGVEGCIHRMLQTPSFLSATDPSDVVTLSVPLGRRLFLGEAKDRTKEIKFVVSSQHDTQEPLARFVKQICPHATLIRQCGNPDEAVIGTQHVLSSDLQTYNRVKDTHHAILYHQEFDLDTYHYHWRGPTSLYIIRQYVNWANHDIRNREFYLWFKEEVCDPICINCREHGRGGEDGEFDTHKQIAHVMDHSSFTLSHKWWDGYGMMVHQSYACGRPVICFENDYKGKLAGLLMEDMKTAIFITNDEGHNQEKLQKAFDREEQIQVGAFKRFCEIVNFDEEEQEIRKWLSEI